METVYKVVQGKQAEKGSVWLNIGMAKKTDSRFFMKMDVMPLPNEKGEVWLQLYEKELSNGVPQEDEKK